MTFSKRSNILGNSLAWDYVRSNWESLIERFTLNNRYLGRLPGQVVSKFVSRFKRDEVEAFFNKYPEGGAGKVADSAFVRPSTPLVQTSHAPLWITLVWKPAFIRLLTSFQGRGRGNKP